jgi:hypothetical protein
MLWGKNRELIDDERMWLWQSESPDGGDLRVVVALELSSQCEVG